MTVLGEQLISIVRAKAAESPDFKYISPRGSDENCVYVHDGKPSCLIGQALWEAGIIDRVFEGARGFMKVAGGFDCELNTRAIREIAPLLLLDINDVELGWLGEVQRAQDTGNSWGMAVARADAEFPVPA